MCPLTSFSDEFFKVWRFVIVSGTELRDMKVNIFNGVHVAHMHGFQRFFNTSEALPFRCL